MASLSVGRKGDVRRLVRKRAQTSLAGYQFEGNSLEMGLDWIGPNGAVPPEDEAAKGSNNLGDKDDDERRAWVGLLKRRRRGSFGELSGFGTSSRVNRLQSGECENVELGPNELAAAAASNGRDVWPTEQRQQQPGSRATTKTLPENATALAAGVGFIGALEGQRVTTEQTTTTPTGNVGSCNHDDGNNSAKLERRGQTRSLCCCGASGRQPPSECAAAAVKVEGDEEGGGEGEREERHCKKQQQRKHPTCLPPANEDESSRHKAAAAALVLVVESVDDHSSNNNEDDDDDDARKVHRLEAAAAAVSRRRSGSCCCSSSTLGSGCSGAGEGIESGSGGATNIKLAVEHCDHDNNERQQPAIAAASAVNDAGDFHYESGDAGISSKSSSSSSELGIGIEQNKRNKVRLQVDYDSDAGAARQGKSCKRGERTAAAASSHANNDRVNEKKIDIENSSSSSNEEEAAVSVSSSGAKSLLADEFHKREQENLLPARENSSLIVEKSQNVQEKEEQASRPRESSKHCPLRQSNLEGAIFTQPQQELLASLGWTPTTTATTIATERETADATLKSEEADEEDIGEQEEEIGKLIEQITPQVDETSLNDVVAEHTQPERVTTTSPLATAAATVDATAGARNNNPNDYRAGDQFKHQQTAGTLLYHRTVDHQRHENHPKPSITGSPTSVINTTTTVAGVTRQQQRNKKATTAGSHNGNLVASRKTSIVAGANQPTRAELFISSPLEATVTTTNLATPTSSPSQPVLLPLNQSKCYPSVMHNFGQNPTTESTTAPATATNAAPTTTAATTTKATTTTIEAAATAVGKRQDLHQPSPYDWPEENFTSNPGDNPQPISKPSRDIHNRIAHATNASVPIDGQSTNFQANSLESQNGSDNSKFTSVQSKNTHDKNSPLQENTIANNLCGNSMPTLSYAPSRSLIFNNPAGKQPPVSSSTHQSLNHNIISSLHQSQAGDKAATSSNTGLMPAPSPLTSFYGSEISSVDTLDKNTNNSNTTTSCASNLSTKTPAHTPSHSARSVAAALQSLNHYQPHSQASQLAHKANQQQQLHQAQPHQNTSTRSPSNTLNSSSSSHGTSNIMPKLGVTNTTSSNHQNHNHHSTLTSSNHQQMNDLELATKFQHQRHLLPNQSLPLLPAPTANWQDIQNPMPANLQHTANSAASPRWPYNGGAGGLVNVNVSNSSPAVSTFSNIPGAHGQSSTPMNIFSNNSHMIGHDGDKLMGSNSSMRSIKNNNNKMNDNNNPRQSSINNHQSIESMSHNSLFDNSKSTFNPGAFSASMNKHSHYNMLDGPKANGPWLGGARSDQQSLPDDWEKHYEALAKFSNNLMSPTIPGQKLPKNVLEMDRIHGMGESVKNRKFYTNHSHLALQILSNTTLVKEFNILDYLRRGPFDAVEQEKMNYWHDILEIRPLVNLLQLAEQRALLQQQHSAFSAAAANSQQSGPISGYNQNDANLRLLSSEIAANNYSNITGTHQQHHAPNRQQAAKNSNMNFLPPPPGKSDFNPSHIDKGRRSSQSPSDINSRSHPNNVPPQLRIMNPHSSPSQYQQLNSNPTNAFNAGSSIIPPSHSIINDQRTQQYSSVTSFQTTRSSPFSLPMAVQNPHINSSTRPPRSSSAIGPLNMLHFDPSIGSSSPLIRQPPAAHQSSTRPNIAASSPSIPDAQLSSVHRGPPVAAHSSSKPSTAPNLHGQENIPMNRRQTQTAFPPSRQLDDRYNKSLCAPGNNHISNRPEQDPTAGLPVHMLLSLKQQQDLALRRGGKPYLNNSGSYSSPNPDIGRQSNMIDMNSSSRSPMNSQFQPLYAQQTGVVNHPFKSPSAAMSPGNFPSMQLTNVDAFKNSGDINKLVDTRFNGRVGLEIPPSGDMQNKQYPPPLLSPYHHQQMVLANKPTGHNGMTTIPQSVPQNSAHCNTYPSSLGSPRATTQNSPQLTVQPGQQPPQQSPKHYSQRSIITGSMSPSPIEGKQKLKVSPTANQVKVVTPTTATELDGQGPMLNQDVTNIVDASGGGSLLMTAEPVEVANVVAQSAPKESTVSSNENAHVIAKQQENTVILERSEPATNIHSGGLKDGVSDSMIKSESDLDVSKKNNNISSVASNLTPVNPQKTTHEPPSKYQKLYTKKAWLKNYDQEDRARADNIEEKVQPIIKSEMTPTIDTNETIDKGENDKTEEDDRIEETKIDIKTEKSERSNRVKRKVMPKRKVKANLKKKSGDHHQSKLPKDAASRKRLKRQREESIVKKEPISDDESIPKKLKKATTGSNDQSTSEPLTRSVGEVFLQKNTCYDIVPKSIRCMECRRMRQPNNKGEKNSQAKKSNWDDFCRFYEFRKLKCTKDSQLVVAGFSNLLDAKDSDMKLWLPNNDEVPSNIDLKTARYILNCIGDVFNNIVDSELEIRSSYDSDMITWKKAVNELRELCDVCSTTLFNYHYFCERCGFVVCIDCRKERKTRSSQQEESKMLGSLETEKDQSLGPIDKNVALKDSDENGQSDNKDQQQTTPLVSKRRKKDSHGWIFCAKNEEHSHDNLALAQIIAGDCLQRLREMLEQHKEGIAKIEVESTDDDSEKELCTWLSDGEILVLKHPRHQLNINIFRKQWRQSKPVIVRGVDKLMKIDTWLPKFFGERYGEYRSDLVDCRNGDIHRHSMKKYWDGFEPTNNKKKAKDAENPNPVHIPATGITINDDASIGACYYTGSALWRLKDWPPGIDFKDVLPHHYEDFMENLPLDDYTTRSGRLNLACRLPPGVLKPDLGPKMYSAYGTIQFPERGTTNLHLDISDAINVMVYVGGARGFESGSDESLCEMFKKTIEDCCVGEDMKEEIRSNKLVPGALWHIFRPSDAQKMREFLNKIADERNISPEKRTDPIHDQTWYLDQVLLDRLYQEHGVKSYAILQCMGDAILIPAGAPHQVKNLQNCIKVANDFVSPENVLQCLQLTNEFRNLPETHINQEDKLQIKNILYHSVKESVQYIKTHKDDLKNIKLDVCQEELNDD